MIQNNTKQQDAISKLANISLVLGILSLFFFILAIVLGFVIEDIGIVSLMSPVLVVAFAAALSGLLARKKDSQNSKAMTGLVIGIAVMGLSLLLRVAIFIFFLPWLGA